MSTEKYVRVRLVSVNTGLHGVHLVEVAVLQLEVEGSFVIADELEAWFAEGAIEEQVLFGDGTPRRFVSSEVELGKAASVLVLVVVGGAQVDGGLFALVADTLNGILPHCCELGIEVSHRERRAVVVETHSELVKESW
jgi:hypothetical protein